MRAALAAISLAVAAACAAPATFNPGDPATAEYYESLLFQCLIDPTTCTDSAGGTITGLVGTLRLQLNGDETLNIAAAGRFSFNTRFNPGTPYTIAISKQPAGQLCAVNKAAGIAGTGTGANITCRTVIYAAGMFTTFNGQSRNGILRLNADGSEDTSFAPGAGITGGTGIVQTVSVAGDGSGDIFIGGDFTAYNGNAAMNIARINSDGSFDPTFSAGTGFDARVRAIVSADDGTGDIYAAGQFTAYNGQTANRIVRLNADGTIDSTFASGTGFGSITRALAVPGDGSGRVYVAGDFTTYNGAVRNRIALLNPDGSVDASFAAGVDTAAVTTIAPAADGSGDIFLGGSFTTVNGAGANRIVRMNRDGTTDTSFNVAPGGANGTVEIIAAAKDGSGDVFLGGNFTTYNGGGVNRLARVNADGSVDSAFNAGTGPNLSPQSIRPHIDGSGKVRLAGQFSLYNGGSANRFVNLNADGTADAGANPTTGFGNTVFQLGP